MGSDTSLEVNCLSYYQKHINNILHQLSIRINSDLRLKRHRIQCLCYHYPEKVNMSCHESYSIIKIHSSDMAFLQVWVYFLK